jgi:hypothetical protein
VAQLVKQDRDGTMSTETIVIAVIVVPDRSGYLPR